MKDLAQLMEVDQFIGQSGEDKKMSHSVTCVFLRFWQFACLCFEWLIIMLLFVMIGRCDYSGFAFEKELAECRHVKSAAITPSLHLLHLFVCVLTVIRTVISACTE